jgi:hypothetical protein
MIEWYLILPIASSCLLLLLFGVGIACSAGFRQVLLGIGGTQGKFSLFNILSAEGAGAILVVAILVGGGIVFPLTLASRFESKIEQLETIQALGQARIDVENLRDEVDRLRHPVDWQVVGQLRLPSKAGPPFKDFFEANDFWNQGTWTIIPVDRQPIADQDLKVSRDDLKKARFALSVRVPRGMELSDWVKQIRYENPMRDVQAVLTFDGREQIDAFSKRVEYQPQDLRQMFSAAESRAGDTQ